jgi:hypothetical protein
MTIVNVEPTDEHPVPYDTANETTETLQDKVAVAANTADLLEGLGAEVNISEGDTAREKELLDAVKKGKNLTNFNTAIGASAFIKTYGAQLAMDAAAARAAITNKLMELANCGEPRFELKALELLGKHSDIGIFTERSEVTIKYEDPAELEKQIKERVKRLLNANVVDVTPMGESLDAELGVFTEEEDEQAEDVGGEPAGEAGEEGTDKETAEVEVPEEEGRSEEQQDKPELDIEDDLADFFDDDDLDEPMSDLSLTQVGGDDG